MMWRSDSPSFSIKPVTSKFVFNTLKSYKNDVFGKNSSAAVLYISNPKPGSRANTISIIQKDEFF